MKPLPPPAILSLIQAGYPIDLTLRFCVHTVNGVRNRYGGAARARPADPEFYPLLQRLRRIQESGAIGFRVQKTNETEGVLMTFRGRSTPRCRRISSSSGGHWGLTLLQTISGLSTARWQKTTRNSPC